MVTNEKRKEVAAKLRKCIRFAKERDQNNEGEMIIENGNVMFRDIAEAVGGDYANFIDSYEETLTKLADLIESEPERTYKIDTSKYKNGGTVSCGVCGKRIPTKSRSTETVEAKYPRCPWCGVKVQS